MTEISELIAKVAAGESLSDDERKELGSYEIPSSGGSENRYSAEARIRMNEQKKQLDTLQKQLEEQTEALEEAKAGGTKAEIAQRKLDKLEAKQAEVLAALETERAGHAATRRQNALNALSIPWMDGVSNKYKEAVLEEAFAGMDADDIADSAGNAKVVAQIIADQSAFVKAPIKPGAGTRPDQALNGTGATQAATDWNKPIDWKAMATGPDGDAKVKATLNQMWAEPAIQQE